MEVIGVKNESSNVAYNASDEEPKKGAIHTDSTNYNAKASKEVSNRRARPYVVTPLHSTTEKWPPLIRTLSLTKGIIPELLAKMV